MARDLFFFKFNTADWLTGNIVFQSLETQGLFINLVALYWQRDCELNIANAKSRYRGAIESLNILIDDGFIQVDENGEISIEFLDEQYMELENTSKRNSINGKKGAQKRWEKDSGAIAGLKGGNGDTIAIDSREEKRRVKKSKEEKKEYWSYHVSDSFKSAFNDYLEMRKSIKSKMTDKAIQLAISKLDKYDEQTAIKMLEQSTMNSWKGLFELKQDASTVAPKRGYNYV
jgi:hypothetical protein